MSDRNRCLNSTVLSSNMDMVDLMKKKMIGVLFKLSNKAYCRCFLLQEMSALSIDSLLVFKNEIDFPNSHCWFRLWKLSGKETKQYAQLWFFLTHFVLGRVLALCALSRTKPLRQRQLLAISLVSVRTSSASLSIWISSLTTGMPRWSFVIE